MHLQSLLTTFAFLATAFASTDVSWYQSEFDLLAKLQARLTGSPQHDELIDHIGASLKSLNLPVHTDTIHFPYNSPQVVDPQLNVSGKPLDTAGWVPYSGTNSTSAKGKLIDLRTSSLTATPNWAAAKDNIAVTNLTNTPLDFSTFLNLYPGSPAWPASQVGVPVATYATKIPNLTAPYQAGVKAVVYLVHNISTGLVDGQYVPFTIRDQPIPAIFVHAKASEDAILAAAANGVEASLSLPQSRIPDTPTRTVYTIIPGTDSKSNETVLLTTHTDGTNIIEENGHIGLLAAAKSLVHTPPRRTTILVFATGHLHYGNLIAPPGRAVTLWLNAHPDLWKDRAVFGVCVEHLGAVHFAEDLAHDTYLPTRAHEPELLYAATAPLANLTFAEWRGAEPRTRVIDPSTGLTQLGEGYPLLLAGIPEVSLVTSPAYLLKVYNKGFDERVLLDVPLAMSQVASFERIWRTVDGLTRAQIGTIPPLKNTGGL